MTTPLVRWSRRLTAQARQRVAQWVARGRDDGFVLLESIIAISLITVIMGAIGTEYVAGLASTSRQRATQVAAQLADSALEQIRALSPTDLVHNHDTASVGAEFSSAPAAVQPWLANMTPATDASPAGSGATAAIPTVGVVQQPGTQAFTVTDYLGSCVLATSGSSTSCVTPPAGTPAPYLRAVVAVTWTSSTCPAVGCAYVTATLISTAGDPLFKVNQPLPAAPIVENPGDQTSAVGDVVSLQLALQPGTGVPPFSWALAAGVLPAGLSLSPAGLISGTVAGPAAPARSLTVTVTDGYQRTASTTFTWTVLPPLTAINPGPQASTTATVVSLALTASGGSGAPYHWSDPGHTLPPGLTLAGSGTSWSVVGTPTVVGNYSVKLTVADSSTTRTTKISFPWTVSYPPLAASNPGNQVSTVGVPVRLQLSASGGSGSYRWSDSTPASLPPGLSISAGGLISGTPTGPVGMSAVTLTVTDTAAGYTTSVSFDWSVVARPTVATPADQVDSVGGTPTLVVSSTCPNGPCTYMLRGGPPGVTLNSAGAAVGKVGGPAKIYRGVTVTVTDQAGATATSGTFTWTVKGAPTLTGMPGENTPLGVTASPSYPIAYTCPNAPCTIVLSGTVPGLGLSIAPVGINPTTPTTGNNTATSLTVTAASGTVYLNGTIQASAIPANATGCDGLCTNYRPQLTITDSRNVATATPPATWHANAASYYTVSSPDGLTTTRGTAWVEALGYACPDTCTLSVSGQPPGIGLALDAASAGSPSVTLVAAGTVYLVGTVSTTAPQTTYLVTLKLVNSAGRVLDSVGNWVVQ